MRVRQKKAAPRKTGGQPKLPEAPASFYTFPAPIRGLLLNDNLAAEGTAGALKLDNYVCTTTGIRPRGGCELFATLGAEVKSLFTYNSGSTKTFFGATATSLFDITSPADPEVAPTAILATQTDGDYSTAQFGTAGGDYLYAVNGADDPLLYDGATWTAIDGVSSPAITGVTTSTLTQVWAFASRLFFVEGNTMSCWYLPVDSIGGAATEFSLAGIFKKGGTLLFGATWSLDAGDGLDDKCVFVSSEGEVAVYEGTNPSSAADWRKVGVYQISKPLGHKAIMQAGGDLLIATEIGLVPLSQAINSDVAALAPQSVSANITPLWQERASVLTTNWEIMPWPQKNYMVVNLPADADGACLVANLQTGAWSRFTGWSATCLGFFDGDGYFGTADGVKKMEQTGADEDMPYTCVYLGRFDPLGVPASQKTVRQARPLWQVTRPISVSVTMATDFNDTIPAPPNSVTEQSTGDEWDAGLWDTAVWGGVGQAVAQDQWVSIGRTGYVFAPIMQMTFGVANAPIAELASFDVTFTSGAVVA